MTSHQPPISAQSPILLRETIGSIAVLTLNRPEAATACRKA